MRKTQQWIMATAITCCALCRVLSPAAEPEKLVILPVGDSITELGRYPQNWRYWLGLHLQSNSIPYDYVGSRTGVRKCPPPPTGDDMDHESYWGWRTDQVMGPAIASAKRFKPNIALIHLGSNDLFKNQGVANAVADMKALINGLRQGNPKIKIFLALIPHTSFAEHRQGKSNLWPLMEELNGEYVALAEEMNTDDSPVYHVEMREGGRFDSLKLTGDGTHPTVEGGKYMARKWFEALQEYVLGPERDVDLMTAKLPLKTDRKLRTWTSTGGSTLEASLLRMGGGSVYLGAGDKKMRISVRKLSEPDVQYLKGLFKAAK